MAVTDEGVYSYPDEKRCQYRKELQTGAKQQGSSPLEYECLEFSRNVKALLS